MERLLEDIAAHGWAKESREAFVRHYDREIGETILHLLAEYGLIGDRRALRSLKSYIESRLREQRAGPEHSLWEIVEEVYMSIYREVFEKKLVQDYVTGTRDGTVKSDFVGYLRGAVRQRLLDALGAGEKSEKELFDAIIDSKKPDTIRKYVSEAKGRYSEKTRSYLLCSQSLSSSSLRAGTDYFFEQFITQRYPALRANLKPGDSVLYRLLEAFIAENYKQATFSADVLSYVGNIPASRPHPHRWATLAYHEDDPESSDEEEKLERAGAIAKTKDWAQDERLRWWDGMLRCCLPQTADLSELTRLIAGLQDQAQRDTKLCLACAALKQESALDQKDDLRMFLVYYLSNFGAPAEPDKPIQVTKDSLCLEMIRGRALSWEQIFKIFGRECNPTRIKNKVRQKYESLQGSLS
ncbi:hypothetical protein HYR54_05065 [Candidatus Acetothermia bacterium]|nr:hypothetical protein [Candidatus Acetothermia bacterium]